MTEKFKIRNKRKAAKSKLNIELLHDAVAWAINEYSSDTGADPEGGMAGRWDQTTWAQGEVGKRKLRDEAGEGYVQVKCGSAYCVAGNICAAAGDRFVAPDYELTFTDVGEVIDVEYVMPRGSKRVSPVEKRAMELLGVKGEHDLFYGDNTIHDVIEKANRIAFDNGYDLFLPEVRQ